MNPNPLSEEALVERPAMRLLGELGWEVADGFGEEVGPAGTLGRSSQTEPVLASRLAEALRRLNASVPKPALDEAARQLTEDRSAKDQVRANREIYNLLRDGARIEVPDPKGGSKIETVRFVDWNRASSNNWLAVSQFWIVGEMHRRRADVVLFVNGIPLVFIELKVPRKNVREAFDDNLRDYRVVVPQLFWFNAFVMLSNGSDTLVGSTFADWGHFGEWKKVISEREQGVVSLETALRGTCEPDRLLDLVGNFIAYMERPAQGERSADAEKPNQTRKTSGLIKALAKNHQYLGVKNSVRALQEIGEQGRGKLGVFWHTQGSGKSLSMLWFTQKVLREMPGNWTFVMVTDRAELDKQLYGDFVDCGVITAGRQVRAETSSDLRELLGESHRYVFTLIHKFIPPKKGQQMPKLSDRSDIVVITDEAHRSQYDTLAANMRLALPNASFIGFTGTPLIKGEEEQTRQVFGDYVSIYNFSDSIADGATVPLHYENRIPELQLDNDYFDEQLEELLEEAALNEDQEKAVARQFSRQYQLITRPNRLKEIAADLISHFVNRGFRGKAMFVAIDKATALRMFDFVEAEWKLYLADVEIRLDRASELERPHYEALIEFMRSTDMAVVVSQAQNEIADMAEVGLDIAKHRKRMVEEDLGAKFKDPNDPFRLVFVCAMWLTGFDSPSTSTVYLDKPMRNHTLMQTIARANRVFPDKDNGLIVDYVGVFRNLENALSVYGVGDMGELPVRPKAELRAELDEALSSIAEFCTANNIDLDALSNATEFEFIALQSDAVEALLVDDNTRREFLKLYRVVRKTFKGLMPETKALKVAHKVAVIRSIAAKIESQMELPDISGVMDSVAELLDKSVAAKEYIISSARVGQPIDLGQIDFDQLISHFDGRKHTAAKAVKEDIEKRIAEAVRKNPTRQELAERFRRLIDEYNAGTHNFEEFFRRLKAIQEQLTDEEGRAVREGLSEEELAIFDLIAKPERELTIAQSVQVKAAAKELIDRIADKFVLDWKRKEQARAKVRIVVQDVLGSISEEIIQLKLFDFKVNAIFDHIYTSYNDHGESIYCLQ